MKKSTLSAGLNKAAAGYRSQAGGKKQAGKAPASGTVLIGGHFEREVRRTLLLVQAEPENAGKTLKQLLGEAINDLCHKYGKPQPYGGED